MRFFDGFLAPALEPLLARTALEAILAPDCQWDCFRGGVEGSVRWIAEEGDGCVALAAEALRERERACVCV
jgi:hypothetical protein